MPEYIVAVDFDGTLATYDIWRGPGIYGEPVTDSREAMWRLHVLGCTLVIWTCRDEDECILAWLESYGYPPVAAINEDVSGAERGDAYRKIVYDVLVDDRAVGWTDWAAAVDDIERRMHTICRATASHV